MNKMVANVYAYQSSYKGRKKGHKKYYNDGYPDKNIKFKKSNEEP